MENRQDCIKCGKEGVLVTKKGFNAKRQQRWKCGICQKTFVVEGSKPVGKPTVKKVSTKKSSVKKDSIKKSIDEKSVVKKVSTKKPEPTITTNIVINSNVIKSVHKDLTIDEAFEMVSSYFREISKTESKETKDADGNKTISFKINTGTKGI